MFSQPEFLKKMAARLPTAWQLELKRLLYARQIARRTFRTAEPEFQIVDRLISAGDWVIDVGANVGHYTRMFSDLVGSRGRVIAFEPVPDTFALLAGNVTRFQHPNVTLLNVAASETTMMAGIQIPYFETVLRDYYRATLTDGEANLQVLKIALDSFTLHHRIRLIKIDAEGHEPKVLRGMQRLITSDHPTLIVETDSPASSSVIDMLTSLGYMSEKLPGSSNTLFRWHEKGTTGNSRSPQSDEG